MSTIGAEQALKHLEGWTTATSGKAISKSFEFKDFMDAWSFMNTCAMKAQCMDHHPEWSNVYNKVDVTLTTHDAGDVTEKDLELAVFMDVRAKTIHYVPE
ncbi:4a-hydroxytetrahydrobiopterin dehydratase [Ponticaulis profundi]|uniref:Putative pterin-4-alpha-carbinolamine dehydratase n=1 Tax=Ponticaulis profundi TaxID=2665222 RepID=A0ABW1S7M7_9PROT